jgi:PhnB protein
MAERDLIEKLNQAVQGLVSSAGPAGLPEDTTVGELVRIAAGLRDLPSPDFRARLKSELAQAARTMNFERRKTMTPAKTNPVREGFRTVTPYLHPAGAARFIDFLKQAFDATEVSRYADKAGGIMHAEVRVGDSMLEMGDADPMPTALHLYVPDVDRVYERALAAGAESLHPLTDQPYGDREGSVKDPFGNYWYIATHQGSSYAPEGLHSITPFLHPLGTPQVIDFLKNAFGAEEVSRHASPDGVIQHAMVRIGDSMIEMGEAHDQWQPMPGVLHLYVDDTDELYRRAMAAGAISLEAPVDKPYGDRSAGVKDPFGNIWYIATPIRDVTPNP